ncbi:DUF397 domain-containing protein [Amycolatopsis sp. NPDC059021]|uniref:DUF397 domain-containing protein n=1 Tax=Amycolatopsis sp. NPDC059021 TaxID=3346704 RepID=UPI00366C8589
MRCDGWFKSSRSKATADCVEVKHGSAVGVRDSKDPRGGQLAVKSKAWRAFLGRIRD